MPDFTLGVTVRRNVTISASSLAKAMDRMGHRLLEEEGRLEITDKDAEISISNYAYGNLVVTPSRARHLRGS